MTKPLKIAIVGYGIAGVAAAIQLRRLGHAIDHFERAACLHTGGAGLLLQPPALKLLNDLGLGANELSFGAKVTGFGAKNLDGHILTNIRYADHAVGSYALGIQRAYLMECLRSLDEGGEQVHFSRMVSSVDTQRGTIQIVNAGVHGPYDLIVAADGAGSSLRSVCHQQVRRDHLYRSAALVACVDDPDGVAGDQLIQYFEGPRHVAVWPVGAAGEGEPQRVNISLNIALQEAGRYRANGAWKYLAAKHSPMLAPLLDRLDDGYNPITYAYRDVSLHRMVHGRLVFIGDAAHSMSPLLGQGARLALFDAMTLALALRAHEDLPTALDAFCRTARANATEFQTISRWLTPVFQSEGRLLAAVRNSVQIAHRLPFVATRVRELLIGNPAKRHGSAPPK